MPMDATTPGSPEWWVTVLGPKLAAQHREVDKYERYYDGTQPLAVNLATKNYRAQFLDMLRSVRDNWMPLVIDATSERLQATGFRMGDDTSADDAAAEMWQRNYLDHDAKLGQETALIGGRCPVMVWAGPDGRAEITVEHPSQCVVAYASGSRRHRVAALKQWDDEWTGDTFVNLYLPDAIVKMIRPVHGVDRGRLVYRGDPTEAILSNPLGVVPVVELRNRIRLRDSHCRSELMEVISTQDQIDKTLVDMLVASEFAAFRQRWATGLELPIDPDTGEEVPFTGDLDRLWTSPDKDTKFGTFEPTELKQYVTMIENRIHSIAARTRTPPHYLLGQGDVIPSGESIKSAETGLVKKVRDRQTAFGEAWEEVIRLGFAVEGDNARSQAHSAQTIWADPESRTEAEHVDAVLKKKSLGVPTQQLWEDLGYTPEQIRRFRTMLLDEALLRIAATPAVAPSPGSDVADDPQVLDELVPGN